MSLFKSASTVSLLTLASRVTGLVRDVLMASVFGVSALTDAFYVAFRIPNLFRRVFGEGAFSQAFVPVLAACKTEHGDEGAKNLVDHVATAADLDAGGRCACSAWSARRCMVWAMASGLKQTAHGFDAAVVMTRWMFPYIGFMSLVALAGGMLNTWRKFAVPAASPVLLNVALILSIVARRALVQPHRHRADLRAVRRRDGRRRAAAGAPDPGAARARHAAAHRRQLRRDSRGLERPDDAQDHAADAAGADRRQRGADLAADQHADRLAPRDRQRHLGHQRRPADGVPDRACSAWRSAWC